MSDNTHPPRTLGHEARRTHDGCAWLSPDEPQSRWWSQPESNRRPPACKAGALPTELWPRAGASLTVEVEVAGWTLLEPEAVVIGSVMEELRRFLEHVLATGLLLVLNVVLSRLLLDQL